MRSTRVERFDVLVCYDVDTTTTDGQRRLRRVAKACEGFGQRVQYSVFECCLSDALMHRLRTKLLDIINSDVDSLRIYYLSSPGKKVECHGISSTVDFSGPLVT